MRVKTLGSMLERIGKNLSHSIGIGLGESRER